MSRVRVITLIFFVTYLPPLKPKACAAKIEFWMGFSQSVLLKKIQTDLRSDLENDTITAPLTLVLLNKLRCHTHF